MASDDYLVLEIAEALKMIDAAERKVDDIRSVTPIGGQRLYVARSQKRLIRARTEMQNAMNLRVGILTKK